MPKICQQTSFGGLHDWLRHLRDEGDSVWQEGHYWLTFQLCNRISIIEFAGLGLHHLLRRMPPPPLHEPAVTVYTPGWDVPSILYTKTVQPGSRKPLQSWSNSYSLQVHLIAAALSRAKSHKVDLVILISIMRHPSVNRTTHSKLATLAGFKSFWDRKRGNFRYYLYVLQ